MTLLRHALEDERHCPVADGGDPPALAGPYDWLVANLRANGLLREAEAVRLLVDAQAGTAPVVPAGWTLVWNGQLRQWQDMANTIAVLSLKAERYAEGRRLKQEIADVLAAAPAAPVVHQADPGHSDGIVLLLRDCAAMLKAKQRETDTPKRDRYVGHSRIYVEALVRRIESALAAPAVPQPAAQQGEAVAPIIVRALELAMAICDRVPTRWHEVGDAHPIERDIGRMVNVQPDGSHGYRLIADALSAAKAAPPARQAVALTDEDVERLFTDPRGQTYVMAEQYDEFCAFKARTRTIERAVWQANGITPAGGEAAR